MIGNMTEKHISAQLSADLDRLGERCAYRTEVWMLCWTHGTRQQADRLRIDYVVQLDGRLLGIEVKAPPASASDLGRDLLQCSQYAAGVIGANRPDVPASWIGKPLEAVFLRTTVPHVQNDDFIKTHFWASHRLFGPQNVGFVIRERRGLCFQLCAERFWTEWRGYHSGMPEKHIRVGNSTVGVVSA